MFVAQQLHYTCRVLESFTGGSFKKLLLKLASLISRLLFGLVTKAIALWLDKRLMFEGKTQGWNALCRKPDGRVAA